MAKKIVYIPHTWGITKMWNSNGLVDEKFQETMPQTPILDDFGVPGSPQFVQIHIEIIEVKTHGINPAVASKEPAPTAWISCRTELTEALYAVYASEPATCKK
jgi:hypothetical protein